MKTTLSIQQRKDDTCRKILLGSFLIARMEHRPEEFDLIKRKLEKFRETHPKPDITARNRALLAAFLN